MNTEAKRYGPEEIANLISKPISLPSAPTSKIPTVTSAPVIPSRIGQRGESRTREDVQGSADMQKIREYMLARKGQHFSEKEDDEVYDAFMNHMRFMNVNEVTTIGEMTWASRADERAKAAAAEAYDTYNSLSNVFVSDGVAGAFDGVADYGRAILTSPSTYLGGVVGRIAVGSATKAGVQAVTSAATQTARQAAKATAMREGAARGLQGKALQELAEEAADKVAKAAASSASRGVMLKQVGTAGAFDVAAGGLQDYLYQSVMMDAGVQDEYSVLQTGIASVGGLVGAGVAAAPYALRGASGLSGAEENIAASFARAKEGNLDRLKVEMEEGLTKIKGSVEEWAEAVKRGDIVLGDSRDASKRAVDLLINEESPYNIFDMFANSRFIFDDGPDAAPKTRQIVEALRDAGDPQAVADLNEVMLREMGVKLDEVLDMVQASIQEGAVNMNYVSRGVARISAARRESQKILNEFGEEVVEETGKMADPKVAQYAASVWRRALVSHPATTMVNVQGWGIATTANTLAQLLHGGTVGTVGLLARVASPVSATAKSMSDAQLKKAARIFQAEAFQIKTLLDPIVTKESFAALVDSMPTKYKAQMESAVFGGVDITGPMSFNLAKKGKPLKLGSRDPQVSDLQKLLKINVTGRFDAETYQAVIDMQKKFGFDETGKVGRQEWAALTSPFAVRKIEQVTNKFARMSAVKLQDTYTKANTFLYELNRQALKDMGMSLDEVLASGKAVDISDDMFRKATEAALERAFSADLTRTGGILGSVYKISEMLSSLPYLGFIFPFGRFVNNNLHFLYQYSPLGMLSFLSKAGVKELGTEEGMEQMFRMIVGLGAIVTLAQWQDANKEKGLNWNQVESLSGDVVDRGTLAPISAYMLAGRMVSSIMKGDEVPDELWTELEGQIGTEFFARGISDSTAAMYDALKYMATLGTPGTDRMEFMEVVKAMGASFAGIGAGFTRPLEPVNVAMGLMIGTTDRIDRRQLSGGDKVLAEATRYVDALFGAYDKGIRDFVGDMEEPKFAGPDGTRLMGPVAQSIGAKTGVYDPNPVARLAGSRQTLPVTSIQRMLAKVDLPEWRANERSGVPELDALINERATRRLEVSAERLLKSRQWRDANQRVRRLMVNELLSEVKKETRDWISSGRLDQRTLVAQRNWLGLNARLRAEAKSHFNLNGVKDTDLSERQIEVMQEWVKHYRKFVSDTADRM